MDQTIQLAAILREKGQNPKSLVANRQIPAIYYGRGIAPKSVTINYDEFRRVYRSAGENTIINLKINDKENYNVLIQEVQKDPVYDKYIHIDFLNIKMDEELVTEIPVILEGVSPAVKNLAGVLVQHMHKVEVKCLPKDLPKEIKGNIEILADFHSALRIKDLIVPPKVVIQGNPELTVATVSAPREEEIEKAPEAAAAAGTAGEGTAASAGATPAAEAGAEKQEGKKS